MLTVTVYIDGFNLYHAIDNLVKAKKFENHLKWINLCTLPQEFIDNSKELISNVFLFTADPTHKAEDIRNRHNNFIRAQLASGVRVIKGQFKRETSKGYDKNGSFTDIITYKEKETDVNIATKILTDAFQKTSQKILLITNDSDISPAIRRAKKIQPNLKISVITPPLPPDRGPNNDLLQSSGQFRRVGNQVFRDAKIIKKVHLEHHLLPEIIINQYGNQILRPKEYTPKS